MPRSQIYHVYITLRVHAHSSPAGKGTDEVCGIEVVVGKTFKQHTLSGPMAPIINASVSSTSPLFVETGVLKYNTKDTITLPSLLKKEQIISNNWGGSKMPKFQCVLSF